MAGISMKALREAHGVLTKAIADYDEAKSSENTEGMTKGENQAADRACNDAIRRNKSR